MHYGKDLVRSVEFVAVIRIKSSGGETCSANSGSPSVQSCQSTGMLYPEPSSKITVTTTIKSPFVIANRFVDWRIVWFTKMFSISALQVKVTCVV